MRATNELNKMHVGAHDCAQKEKGITLIALVITIIVMLILVAVTISMAINGGLFSYAGKAELETNGAITNEQELANLEANMTVDELIDKYTGSEQKITAKKMQENLKSYLGKLVNYGISYNSNNRTGWEIFYADDYHIYIIARGSITVKDFRITGYNGTSDFTLQSIQNKYPAIKAGLFNKTYNTTSVPSEVDNYLKYTSSYYNMKVTQYLLDSTKWGVYSNSKFADWAIGGPTFELFVNSYNAFYPDNNVTLNTPQDYGYNNPLWNSESLPSGTYLHHPDSYCLASPAGSNEEQIMFIFINSNNVSSMVISNNPPIRPVVCLKSNVQIIWNETTSQYDLGLVTEN